MWLLEAGLVAAPPSFLADLWHSFLVFLAMFLAHKVHDGTKP